MSFTIKLNCHRRGVLMNNNTYDKTSTGQKRQKIRQAARHAFPPTIPIFAGFWFLGMTYGVYMNVSGFNFLYPLFMSMAIFGGSLEFVAVEMMLSAFAPVQNLIMALMIQDRHLFYVISMQDKFKVK